MKHLKQPFRIGWRLVLLIAHILLGLLLAALFLRKAIHSGTLAARLSLWWHSMLCKIFGVQCSTRGSINPAATLFVVNHISWFDIPALGSKIPVHFLSKDEVNSWPIIGWLARQVGTLFIKRGQQGAAEQSIDEISDTLRQGGYVVIFPEGTTTDGTSVRKFHSRLFQAAINAGVAVQPVALRYPHPDGVHPKAPFIGDTQFLQSTLDMMSEPQMQAELEFLPPIDSHGFNRSDLAMQCQQTILAALESHQPAKIDDDQGSPATG
ncbi:MAG: 1-acyl-sn-glycerol-3-phosphate acyltransferase [Gammaproteobacteria bacterium]|nr:1-acyl-sn-glycerol-3-phosphate acyltransferase [Gammaproteobacteria bacterium]